MKSLSLIAILFGVVSASTAVAEGNEAAVYIDGPMVYAETTPKLVQRDDSDKAPWPFFTEGFSPVNWPQGWDKDNFYTAYRRDAGEIAWRKTRASSLSWKPEALEQGMPESHRHRVVATGSLRVEKPSNVLLRADASYSVNVEDECYLQGAVDQKAIGLEETGTIRDGGDALKISGMLHLEAGEYDLKVAAWCDFNRYGTMVDSLDISGISGDDEQAIKVHWNEAQAPEQVEKAGLSEEMEAATDKRPEAAMWSGSTNDAREGTMPDPEAGVLPEKFDLVMGFGQSEDFLESIHGRSMAAKMIWYPHETGVYQFMVKSRSNICHAVDGHGMVDWTPELEETNGVEFRNCRDQQYRQPSAFLAVQGRGAIMSEPATQSDAPTLARYGFVEVGSDDLETGVVLDFSSAGEIGIMDDHRYDGELAEMDYEDQALIVDLDGETYAELTGITDDQTIAMTPTKERKGYMTASILIKEPSSDAFGPITKADTMPVQ